MNDATKIAIIESESDQIIATFADRLGRANGDGKGEALYELIERGVGMFRCDPDPLTAMYGELMTLGWSLVITRLAGEGCIPPPA